MDELGLTKLYHALSGLKLITKSPGRCPGLEYAALTGQNNFRYIVFLKMNPVAMESRDIFRELENINVPELHRNFWSYSRHVNSYITGYVTVDATKKTIKKASKFGILIFGSSLITT